MSEIVVNQIVQWSTYYGKVDICLFYETPVGYTMQSYLDEYPPRHEDFLSKLKGHVRNGGYLSIDDGIAVVSVVWENGEPVEIIPRETFSTEEAVGLLMQEREET